MMKMVLWLIVGAVIALGLYIRLAPSDPARWHLAVAGTTDEDMQGGVIRMVETGPDGLAKLDVLAQATPRTTVLAGSVEDGMITYVTRTQVIGFPDYTTVQQDGDVLRFHARLRFGRSDFGVNRDRVDGWLAALQL